MESKLLISVLFYFIQFAPTWEAMSPFCDFKTNIAYDLCCPGNCSNGTAKNSDCIAQCPGDMHIIKQNCLNSKDEVLSDFTCVSTCPVYYYGILLNNTNVCVECSLLCQTPYFKTLCACTNQEVPTIGKLYEILTVAFGTTLACLFIVFTFIVGYKTIKKCSADKSIPLRADQEKGLQPEEFKIATETDSQPDTNKIETVDGNPTLAKIAKEAQTKLDEKSRYVKDPTENIKALHQKQIEASIRQSHAYANLSTIQRARNFFNRTSGTLYNIIRPKSRITISKDKTQFLPTDIRKNLVADEAVYNSIIDDGKECAHCSGNINVSIECHVRSNASESMGLSANNQFDREKDTDAGMHVGTKTSKTVPNIKTRNLCDENECVKNTIMQGTKVKKKKRALQKTNSKQKFTEQNDNNTGFLIPTHEKNAKSQDNLPSASIISSIKSSTNPRISYDKSCISQSSTKKLQEQAFSSSATNRLEDNSLKRNNHVDAKIHVYREVSERIQDGKTENSLLVGMAGVEKTLIEETSSSENEYNTTKVKEHIYENAAYQREVVDKRLPVVPSNNSITSSSSSNSQRPSSDDSSRYDTACESSSSEKTIFVKQLRKNCGDTSFDNIQICDPAEHYDVSEVSSKSTINYSKIEGGVVIVNSDVTIVKEKEKRKGKRN